MDEVESGEFDNYELNYPPKLSFEEMNLHLRNTPYHILKKRQDILKTFFFYSKDSKSYQILTKYRKEAHADHPASLLVIDNPIYSGKRQENQELRDKTTKPACSK